MTDKNIKKNIFWNTIGTTITAFTSLFYMIFVTRINGIDEAGIFTFAFSIALVIQVIGDYAGRVYQVTNINKKISDSDFIYNHIITSLLMIAVGIIFCLFREYNTYKFMIIMILLLFRSIESFADSVFGVIQKNGELYKVGISLAVKGILSLLLFLIVDITTKNVLLSCLAILLVQLIILFFYDFRNLKKEHFKLQKINKEGIILIFRAGFDVFIFNILLQYILTAPKYPIDSYLTDNNQSIYGIISMPATMMILIAKFIIHPLLNKLTNYIKKKDFKSFNNTIFKMSASFVGIGLFCFIVCWFIGIPILNIVYGLELTDYKNCLNIILIGSIIYGVVCILSNALIALRDTKLLVGSYMISSIIAYIISDMLVKKSNIIGASYSYLITMICLAILLLVVYLYIVNKKNREVLQNEKK